MELKELATGASPGEQSQEEDLVRRARAGDFEAREELVTKYGQRLLCFIRQRVRSWRGGEEDVEDVLQETWLSVWAGLSAQPPLASFVGWATEIARCRCADWHRQRQRRRAEQGLEPPLAEEVEERSPLDDPLVRQEKSDQLRQELNELPQERGDALRMFYLEGMSEKMIAERTGWPLNTVKIRKHRGLQELKDKMSEDEYDPGYPYQHFAVTKGSLRATNTLLLTSGRLFMRWSVRRLSLLLGAPPRLGAALGSAQEGRSTSGPQRTAA